jgi:hypothetical protein
MWDSHKLKSALKKALDGSLSKESSKSLYKERAR